MYDRSTFATGTQIGCRETRSLLVASVLSQTTCNQKEIAKLQQLPIGHVECSWLPCALMALQRCTIYLAHACIKES
jgi:hypothetical protein